jgi:glucans biosynthesis protein
MANRSLPIHRRQLLALAGALLPGLSVAGLARAAAPERQLGPPVPFDFERLRATARALAARPHVEPAAQHAKILEAIDYDAHQTIRFRPERALWAGEAGRLPVQFFHLHRYAQLPVEMHVVEDGEARELLYQADDFTIGSKKIARELPGDLGFAGFRVMDGPGMATDWLAYQGASYFRTSGSLGQYGLSARGLAIDTAMPWPEEFPRFSQFWLQPGAADDRIVVYALLEGPSVAGAYQFDWQRSDGAVVDVRAELFCRTDIARLGMAPLTSMFWFGENNRHQATDWRPEIHDSDGLALWTGTGERIWRPLENPPRVQTSVFVDRDPKGFGLLQRDRAFHDYEDDGVFYDRRPSVWVEPLGDWGAGAVQLVEIPTDDEIHDNIVAYWVPEAKVEAGSAWSFRYRLHWHADEPHPPTVARVLHTRTGRGGVPGQPRPEGVRKFVIDFDGGQLEHLTRDAEVEPVIATSRGRIDNPYALQIVATRRWRAVFDLAVSGSEPVELRCFLRLGERTLSETWLYQHWPQGGG